VKPPELLEIGKAGKEIEYSAWHVREEPLASTRYVNLLIIIAVTCMQSKQRHDFLVKSDEALCLAEQIVIRP